MISVKRTTVIATLLILLSGYTSTLAQSARIKPITNNAYFLEISMMQETESENSELANNLSLELSCNIIFQLRDQLENSIYMFDASYENLELSFFSPQVDYYISSSQNDFKFIREYLAQLEQAEFPVTLSSNGQCLHVTGIDSLISSFQAKSKISTEQRQLFIKTIKEAFGEKAFKSLINLALHIYPNPAEEEDGINTYLFFNAREIPIRENFFIQSAGDQMNRVQGIGVIAEKIDTIQWNDFTLISSLKGNQTYDFLVYEKNGWIKEGISKQKIHSVSKISGHSDLPEGLKIPSLTITDYAFRGGILDNDTKK
ncbi:MAG TPA: DUF6263 family protein [Bacteroidales bacterium]|nr:DUF6263 family protein [Bacteroidales bacterium]